MLFLNLIKRFASLLIQNLLQFSLQLKILVNFVQENWLEFSDKPIGSLWRHRTTTRMSQNKRLTSKTMALHVRYTFWHIS